MQLIIILLAFLTTGVLTAPGTLKPYPTIFDAGRVVGGHDAEQHQFPFIVSLQLNKHFCGGSIITEDYVVTAGHCLIYEEYDIVAGAHNLKADEETVQKRQNDFHFIHEKYVGGVGPYDIGIIKVKQPFELNKYVSPIALPAEEKIHSGDAELAGWGSTSTSIIPNMPNILQTVDVPIVPWDECEKAIPGSPLHKTNVCTGPLDGGLSACSGDSGGPLVQKSELVGIVSWGYIPCGQRGRPAVYTRVSAHVKWILEFTQ